MHVITVPLIYFYDMCFLYANSTSFSTISILRRRTVSYVYSLYSAIPHLHVHSRLSDSDTCFPITALHFFPHYVYIILYTKMCDHCDGRYM